MEKNITIIKNNNGSVSQGPGSGTLTFTK